MEDAIKLVKSLIEQGENSSVEFKREDIRPEGLARELTAFSNSGGGIILIGVEDDGQVSGISKRPDIEEWAANVARNNVIPAISPELHIVDINGCSLLMIRVPKEKDKPYQSVDGKYWFRVGSTNRMATKEELSRLFQQAGLIHFDVAPLHATKQADLDIPKLQDYWQTYYNIDYQELEQKERRNLLLNSDILVIDRDGVDRVSVGGIAIFGEVPQRRLPQSSIMFAVFDGDDLTESLLDKQEITGTLPELIRQTVAKMNLFLPKPSTISGLKRSETPCIPGKVLRESIVNAVCHRDYSISNRKITVYMFRHRIEITSPGRLPNTLTIEKILTGNSAPRNSFLLKYLDNMKFIDGLGRGVPMIKRAMEGKYKYEEEGELLRLTLFTK